MTFGERLKTLRIERGMTQVQLAAATGLSQSALSQWELGSRKGGPSVADLFAICDALGVDCSAFRPDASDPTPTEKPKA